MSPTTEPAVSRPDKVLLPDVGLTKADVVRYYTDVADALLPHLADRPLTLRRYPDGIEAHGFVQKDASDFASGSVDLATVELRGADADRDRIRQVVCSDLSTLQFLVDKAVIELHVPLSRVGTLDHPDRLVVDLDPPDGVAVGELRSVARRARDLLTSLQLTAYLQATGGRGFHIVAPLDATADFARVRDLATGIADRLADDDPRRLTTAQRKDDRGDRIFLDVNRNAYGQTVVAPYVLRARPGAHCSVPLDFAELSRSAPAGWTTDSLRRRLTAKDDPWATIDHDAGSATTALELLAELNG